MLYLVDTSMLSAWTRDDPIVRGRIAQLPAADRVCTCTIVVGEVLFGIERLPQGRRRRQIEQRALTLLGALPCEPVPEAAAAHYARIKRANQAVGLTSDENDLWIAATTDALSAVLLSRDSDFKKVAGLKVEAWTSP